MARPLRLEFAGALYHLTARGNARADIFADNDDRRLFLELLGKKTLCSRAHQEAFQGWVYLLRRAVNLPLQEVAQRGKVSPSRISKIQRAIETGKVPATLRQLLHKCKVKN
jgi:hypothetical protein